MAPTPKLVSRKKLATRMLLMPTAQSSTGMQHATAVLYGILRCSSYIRGQKSTGLCRYNRPIGVVALGNGSRYCGMSSILSVARPAVCCSSFRRNMVTSFVYHERIRTTVPRAKELRKLADNMVTLAKKGDETPRLFWWESD